MSVRDLAATTKARCQRALFRVVPTLVLSMVAAMPATAQDSVPGVLPLRATGQGHTQRIYRGVFTPDSKTFLSAGIDQAIRAFDVADGKPLFALEGQKTSIHAIGLAGAKLLVSAGENGTIFLWDLGQRKQIGDLPRHKYALHCLAVSHDGKVLATGGGDWKQEIPGELRLWDLEKREALAVLTGHRRLVLALAFSPDDRLLAASDPSGDVRVWDLSTRKPVVTLFQEHPVGALSFSPDGKRLATGDYSGRITVWDTTDWYDEAFVQAHRSGVMSLSCAPTGTMLAAASWDGNVKLWDWARLEEQIPLQVGYHKDKAWQVAFAPDGKTLASAGEDALVRFWAIPPEVARRFQPLPPPVLPAIAKTARVGPARVAVIAAARAGPAGIVEDLALARLSGDKGLILLDRSAVARLLQEQNLSVSGLVDASTAVRVGKILAVDLVGVIETSPDVKQTDGCVVFDAVTGVRLLDAGFGGPNVEQQSREVAAGVRAAVQKWRAGTKNVKTVCFLPVRNADLPRPMDAFCEAISTALERQLLQHPAIVALERKRLDAVANERQLSGEAATRELLASVLLVQLQIARAQDSGGVRATVTIRDNAGKPLHKIVFEVADPNGANLLGPLVERVHAALQTAPGQAIVKRSREARRFGRESELLWKHAQYLPALQAAEAAHALSPDEAARRRLAEYLARYAREMWKPGVIAAQQYTWKSFTLPPEKVRNGLDMARRADQLVDPVKDWYAALSLYPDSVTLSPAGRCFSVQNDFLQELAYLTVEPSDPEVEQAIRERRIAGARLNVARVQEMADRAGPNPQAISRLQYQIAMFADALSASAPDTTVQMDALLDMLRIWLDVAGRVSADVYPVGPKTALFVERGLLMLYHPRRAKAEYSVADRARTLPLFEAMQKHPHPVLRLYASHYLNKQLVKLGRIGTDEARLRENLLAEEARAWIDKAAFKAPDRHRVALYGFLDHQLQSAADLSKERIEGNLGLAEFALQRKDVVADVWIHAAYAAVGVPAYHARSLNLIRRMDDAYAAAPHRLFHDPGKRVEKELQRARAFILKISPQLDREQAGRPWDRVLPLAEVGAFKNISAFMAPTRHNHHVYLIGGGADPANDQRPFVQLIRAALDGSPPQALGKASVNLRDYNPKQPTRTSWSYPRFVTQCAIDGERIYVGTLYDGIYVFPLAGGDGVRIGEKEGLPALGVPSLVALEGQLVAALDGGYLVAYDLEAKRCDVIASSRRLESRSPFDNGKPFRALDLVADPPRHRALFHVIPENVKHPSHGTWEYSLKTRQFTKLLPMALYHPTRGQDGTLYLLGREWLTPVDQVWIGRFDLASDKFTLLSGKSPAGIERQTPSGLPADFSAAFPGELFFAGYHWRASSFARQPIKGGAFELLQHVRGGRELNADFEFLDRVSSNELLIGDRRGLYLLRLKDAAVAGPTP